MKRITLLTAIWILTAMTVFAEHEYIPFATPGKQWVSSIPATCLVMQTINGDTVIENIRYQRLELYTKPYFSKEKVSYIREAENCLTSNGTLSLYDLSGSCLANGNCIDLSDFQRRIYSAFLLY